MVVLCTVRRNGGERARRMVRVEGQGRVVVQRGVGHGRGVGRKDMIRGAG